MSAAISVALGELAVRLRASTVAVRVGRCGAGSGVVWTRDGAIVTNAHVATAARAEVAFADGRTFEGRVERRDAARDLALLRIDAADVEPARTRDPATLRVGEILVAFGHPMGVANALTMGIAHAPFGRGERRFVSADVRLAPGNSGGPLADVEGRVVGINSITVGGDFALAIPSDDVARFAGTVPLHARLGVRLVPVRLRDGSRAFAVSEVDASSRAAAAGLMLGDILLVRDPAVLPTLTHLAVLRGGRALDVVVPPEREAQLAAERRRRVAVFVADGARERLVALLDDRFDVVTVRLADVVIVDVAEPHALVLALDDARGAPTIALIADPNPESVAVAIRAGAAAVIARMSDRAELAAAIDAVATGLIVIDPAARDAFAAAPPQRPGGPDALTSRERDVLALLARGLSNKRIAERLDVSEHTVKFHVGSVLAKLGAATRAEAVALGVRGGYVIV